MSKGIGYIQKGILKMIKERPRWIEELHKFSKIKYDKGKNHAIIESIRLLNQRGNNIRWYRHRRNFKNMRDRNIGIIFIESQRDKALDMLFKKYPEDYIYYRKIIVKEKVIKNRSKMSGV